MKKIPALLRVFLVAGMLLVSARSYASHIMAAELRYKWITGLTYQVTINLYGDCSSTTGAFNTLYTSNPQVCWYDGNTFYTSMNLPLQSPDSGLDISPVCRDSFGFTTCNSLSYDIPGIKKFVYSSTITLNHSSANWRLIYEGNNPGGSAAGRSSAITNLFSPGSTLTGLIDTLNTTTSRGHNSNPVLSLEPIPYFCGFVENCYNPSTTDIYDTSTRYHEPTGDSLVFNLTTPLNGTAGCNPTLT